MSHYEKAVKLLDEIENGIDMTLAVNKQFVMTEHVILQTRKGELPRRQANQQLKELLFLTMPPADSGAFFLQDTISDRVYVVKSHSS